MSFTPKEKNFLKNNISSIMYCICGFVTDETAKEYIFQTKTIKEFLLKIISDIKNKEETGWDGSDLPEEQLNLLTLVSEMYLKKNKSKYKIIEKPSEILIFLDHWIENNFNKKELKWKEKNEN